MNAAAGEISSRGVRRRNGSTAHAVTARGPESAERAEERTAAAGIVVVDGAAALALPLLLFAGHLLVAPGIFAVAFALD